MHCVGTMHLFMPPVAFGALCALFPCMRRFFLLFFQDPIWGSTTTTIYSLYNLLSRSGKPPLVAEKPPPPV